VKRALGAAAAVALAVCASSARAQDLAPPAAVPPPPGYPGAPAPGATPTDGSQPNMSAQADLDKAQKEDSGLGLEWVWATADVGASYVDMKSFSASQLAVTNSNAGGAVWGLAAGVRIIFLTLGVRVRNHTALNLWQIDADVGFHMRINRFDPYLAFRGGYDTVGTLSQSVDVATTGGSVSQTPQVQVHGGNAGMALGFDYYLAHAISFGGEAAGDVLFLSRPASPLPALTPAQQMAINASPQAMMSYQQAQQLYAQSGSSVGFGATFTAHVGIHF
jgi:hypothetical protein